MNSASGRITAIDKTGDLRDTLPTAAAVAAAYYILAKIGLLFLVQPDGFSAIWPTAGLLPAVLLILRKKDRVPTVAAVFAAGSIANVTSGMSPGPGVAYAAVNCAESIAAAWALGRITGGKVGTLGTGDFFRFLLYCVLAICGGSAVFGAAISVLLGGNPSYSASFFLWWASDGAGMMMITPVALSMVPLVRSEETISKDRLVETLSIAIVVCAVTAFVFVRSPAEPLTPLSMLRRPWLILVPMMWAALRLRPRCVSFLSLLLWSIAIFFTSHGYGPYRIPGIPVEASFTTLFAFLVVAYISSYVTSSLLRETAEGRKRELEIARKRESLETMAGGVAHQFNNMLTGVLGYIVMAKGSLPPSSTAWDHLREAEASAKRAAELSRSMLIYVGQGVRQKKLQELAQLVQEHLPRIRPSLPGNVRLEIDAPPGGPAAFMDPADFRQVLSTLFTNAWEAMGGAEGVVRISVCANRDEAPISGSGGDTASVSAGPWACLKVTDTGLGMDNETMDRIFDPFFSTKFIGRGLGLPVVQGIVRHYGGSIHVRSHPGQGTTVSVFFPAAERDNLAQSDVHSIHANVI